MQYVIRGMAGLQGPHYSGTNTLHRRNVIYGLYPDEIEIGRKGLSLINHEILSFIIILFHDPNLHCAY